MSLRIRLVISVVAAVLLIAGLGAAIDYRREYDEHVGKVLLSLQEQASALRAARARIMDETTYISYVKDVCEHTISSVSPGHHIFILHDQGGILARSHEHVHPELENALLSTDAQRSVLTLPGHKVGQARTKAGDGTTIVVAEYLDDAKAEAVGQLVSRAEVTTAVALALAGLLALTLSHWVLTPLRRLAAAAKVLGGGDLSSRTPVAGAKDVQTVQHEFNRMAERLEENDRELRRSNNDLEQFARVVSHDLKQPLSAVGWFVELLGRQAEANKDGKSREYLAAVSDALGQTNALIADLLDYSRVGRQATHMKPTDMNAVLDQALANCRAAIEESRADVVQDRLPVVVGDHGLLVRVMQNLICNAVKYRSQRPPRVQVSVARTGQAWTFSVRDNGIGIAAEHLERIFQAFQRLNTEGAYEGTGLGLAICRKIVELHGGRIWAESEIGKGATFSFTLPAAD